MPRTASCGQAPYGAHHGGSPFAAPASVSRPAYRAWRRGVVLATVLTLATAGVAALLYFLSLHSEAPSSDGATLVLEGQAMARGNLALKGWALSLDSFWAVDGPLYLLAVLVAGLRSVLLQAVPAAVAAVTAVLGAWAASAGRRGVPAVVGGSATLGLLALPSHSLAIFLLKGGQHVTTAAVCLTSFVALARRGSGRGSGWGSGTGWGWGWLAGLLLLAAGLLGDLLTAAFGVVPVCLAGVVAMARQRRAQAGTPLVCAGLGGLGLAAAVHWAAGAIGTFSLVHVQSATASGGQVLAGTGRMFVYLGHLLGVGSGYYGPGGVPGPLQWLHLAGLAVVAFGLVGALARAAVGALGGPGAPTQRGPLPRAGLPTRRGHLPRLGTLVGPGTPGNACGSRLDNMLAFGTLGSLATYVLVASSPNPAYSRYLSPAVVFGAVLGGRALGRVAARSRLPRLRPAALAGTAAVLAGFAAGAGVQLAQPLPPQPTARLARFLQEHDLRAGLGDYWSSSVVTVQSDGRVVVRPVIANRQGRLVRYARQSSAGWYQGRTFQFLVFNTTQPFGAVGQRSAARTFGPPSRSLSFGPYLVLIWPHPVAVSPVGVAT